MRPKTSIQNQAMVVAIVGVVVLVIGILHIVFHVQENGRFDRYSELVEAGVSDADIAQEIYGGRAVNAANSANAAPVNGALPLDPDNPITWTEPGEDWHIPPIAHQESILFGLIGCVLALVLFLLAWLVFQTYPGALQFAGMIAGGLGVVLVGYCVLYALTNPSEFYWAGMYVNLFGGLFLVPFGVVFMFQYRTLMTEVLVHSFRDADARLRGMPGITATRDGALVTAPERAAAGSDLASLRSAVARASASGASGAGDGVTTTAAVDGKVFSPITRARDSMIVTDALTKFYGPTRALAGVSLSVERGEIVGFLGPNGAGKSTCMKILTTYLQPTSGQAWVAGYSVLDHPLRVRESLGYLPESTPLYREMTVSSYLTWAAQARNIKGPERVRNVDWVVRVCSLKPVLKMDIGQLSKGFRQRVGIAQALLHEPELLILDEPINGLDPNQIIEVRELIAAVGETKTVLLSTHIMQEVSAMCSRVMVINRGQLVANASVTNLQQALTAQPKLVLRVSGPRDEVTRAINGIAGVESCQVQDEADELAIAGATRRGRVRLDVHPRAGTNLDSIGTAAARVCSDRSWSISEIRQETASLEDVFVALTGGAKS